MKKVFLYCGIFLIIIGLILIISQNDKNNYADELNEELYGDYINDEFINDDYIFSFDEVTIPNEKLVIYDNSNLDYLRYYVIVFTGDQYIQYVYNFMRNHDQYIEKFKELSSSIVDYNYDELMIKNVDLIDYGTYDQFLINIKDILDNNMAYVIY